MWLTDVHYMNDSEEMHNGITILIKYMKHRVEKFPHPHKLFKAAADYVEGGLVGKSVYGLDKRPIFVGSFSRAGNLLSQWRAYGSYSIEIDTDYLPQDLFECIYDDDEKHSRASDVVLLNLILIAKDMEANSGSLTQDGYEAFSNIVELVATFKHASFSEEEEVRVVLGHDINPGADYGLNVEFRSRGNILIPYVKATLPFECIRSIHVGPMRDQELACASLRSFVEKMHLKHKSAVKIQNHIIQVKRSEIPYRAP